MRTTVALQEPSRTRAETSLDIYVFAYFSIHHITPSLCRFLALLGPSLYSGAIWVYSRMLPSTSQNRQAIRRDSRDLATSYQKLHHPM